MARWGFFHFDSGARWDAPDANPNVHMIDLHRFLQNPFDDKKISLAELIAFSTDHLQRMIANNPGGELAARITATTSALQVVENCATDDQTKLGLRKARKMAKDGFRTALPEKVAKIIAAVAAKFGPNAPEVVECCPEGRTIFRTSPDDQLAMHLQLLLTALTAHQAAIGAGPVTDAQGLLTSWNAVYAASETSSALASRSMLANDTLRAPLSISEI